MVSSSDWVRFRLCFNGDANIEKAYTVPPLTSEDKKAVTRSGMLEGIFASIVTGYSSSVVVVDTERDVNDVSDGD